MPIISLSKVGKAYGVQVLLEDVTLSVNDGDKIGIVGPNGAGKTTLLRVMAGHTHPSEGEVHVARGTRIGMLDQEPDFAGHGSVLEAAQSAFARVHEIEDELAAIHEKLATHPAETDKLLRRQAELEHEFDDLGGYSCTQRAEAVLAGVGFHADMLAAPVEQLSGGERSRLAVAHLLLQRADVLLLDEPTNHLDVAGLEWLEDYLGNFAGTVVVVSHDRQFLDRFAKRILDFQGPCVEAYKGNYSTYLPQKKERLVRLQKEFEAQQAFIKREEFYIKKYIAGQRGREAKGRRKRLNRMEVLEAPTREKSMHVRIEPELRGGNEVLNLIGLGKSFDGRTLFSGLDLQVLRGYRIGIIGENGSGKTTLLRIIIGEEKPDEGVSRVGHQIDLGYYRQDRNELDPKRTVLDEVWATAPQSRAGEL
ncbi:ABC-F family ATP-binding cassette domain-containing protein, partial [bacterium]|nr:ABC-F family ATP-binding cassette domain-containing protein [bacterium]